MDADLLQLVAQRFGTPCYVYDLDAVAERVARVRAAHPAAALLYAVKANPNGALLRSLAELGVGAEVITLGELERAVRAGIPGERLLVGGPGQDEALVRRAAKLRAGLVSLDSAGPWPLWRAHAPGATRFLVRVNPGLDPATHAHLATGAATSKFGLAPAAALELASRVAADGRLAGFHVHAGSMLRDPELVDAVGEVLAPLYAAVPGCTLLDLGGGFAVPDFPLEAYLERAAGLAERLRVELVLEPGRFLTADAGVLLTRVLYVKRDGPTAHLIADAGMADLLRPALYGAEHPIRVVGDAGAARSEDPSGRSFDVDGPLCENADRLGRARLLPGAGPGSLLAVERAGAYGFAMASNYASSLRPAEVVVRAGEPLLARRRERPEDLWRLELDAAG